jgi:Mce-associated membrane protein
MRVITDSALDTADTDPAGDTMQEPEIPIGAPEPTGDDNAPSGAASQADTDSLDTKATRRIKWPAINTSRAVVFGLLPILVLMLAVAAGYFKWQESWTRGSTAAAVESLAAAKESTVALLSYQPDTAEKDLDGARGRLTGPFKESYSQLIHDVVVPGAKKQHVATVATIAAASSVSATPSHAVALLFINQTVTIGDDSPSQTESAVRVTLDKSGNRWLISGFDPV